MKLQPKEHIKQSASAANIGGIFRLKASKAYVMLLEAGLMIFCSNLTAEKLTDRALSAIVEYELIPLLKEYWFDEPMKVKDWTNNLRSAVK